VKGVSENVEVRSIIDRYLEHARVFYFRNGGHEEVYLSSADWMERNLLKRLEILFPVIDANLRRRMIDVLKTFFADNVKARELQTDGTYEPVPRKRRRIRAQDQFYTQAVETARAAEQTGVRFRPLSRPEQLRISSQPHLCSRLSVPMVRKLIGVIAGSPKVTWESR